MLGLTTPVESAAIGGLGGVIAVAIKKKLSLKLIKDALIDSSKLTAIMMWIFMGALTFGQIYDAVVFSSMHLYFLLKQVWRL